MGVVDLIQNPPVSLEGAAPSSYDIAGADRFARLNERTQSIGVCLGARDFPCGEVALDGVHHRLMHTAMTCSKMRHSRVSRLLR